MKPNLVIPLASSYDQRNPLGDTGAQAGYDQRKVNCYYEHIRNAATGKVTLLLSKRPGVQTQTEVDDYGTATQVPYLMASIGAEGGMPMYIVKDGSNTNVIYPVTPGVTGSTTVSTDADYAPVFISAVNISGTVTYVLQLKKEDTGIGLQKAFWSTNYSTWTEISDSDFTGISHRGKVAHLDGTTYVAGDRGIHGSDINSVTAWTAGNFVPSSVEFDYMQGLIPFGDRLLLFGENTCQQFYNAGNASGSPLKRVSARVDRAGLSARYFNGNDRTEYYCTVDNRLFLLGKMSNSWQALSLLTYNGASFEQVSGVNEDRLIQESPAYGVFPVSFHGQNAVGILLTAPGAATARWLMFFPSTRSWFEWESTVYTAIGNGTFFAGVTDPDKLYFQSLIAWADDGTDFTFLTQFRLPFDDGEWKTMSRCGVMADTVSGATLTVKFNDAGAGTYGSGRTLDLSKVNKEMYRCGTFRERWVQLSDTSNKRLRLRNFNANVE